ncbi:hypothetical protein ACIGHN_27700 [Acidovorax sp. NPDC077693]|uniref:hypothetical protein n=1 Tax=unclassified Acidovorax TaxID=2684926 RepID=UPI0037C525ED
MQTHSAGHSAKIRVFHGTAVYMHPGQVCYGARNQEKIHAAAGGYSMLVANKKVGMPATDDIPWSYHEYVIPAEKPLTLEMYWAVDAGGARSSCGPIGATFTPEAGRYYDTSMLVTASSCSVQLRELTEISPGKASAKIKTTTPALKCPEGADR